MGCLSYLCFLERAYSVFTVHGMFWKQQEQRMLMKEPGAGTSQGNPPEPAEGPALT